MLAQDAYCDGNLGLCQRQQHFPSQTDPVYAFILILTHNPTLPRNERGPPPLKSPGGPLAREYQSHSLCGSIARSPLFALYVGLYRTLPEPPSSFFEVGGGDRLWRFGHRGPPSDVRAPGL